MTIYKVTKYRSDRFPSGSSLVVLSGLSNQPRSTLDSKHYLSKEKAEAAKVMQEEALQNLDLWLDYSIEITTIEVEE